MKTKSSQGSAQVKVQVRREDYASEQDWKVANYLLNDPRAEWRRLGFASLSDYFKSLGMKPLKKSLVRNTRTS